MSFSPHSTSRSTGTPVLLAVSLKYMHNPLYFTQSTASARGLATTVLAWISHWLPILPPYFHPSSLLVVCSLKAAVRALLLSRINHSSPWTLYGSLSYTEKRLNPTGGFLQSFSLLSACTGLAAVLSQHVSCALRPGVCTCWLFPLLETLSLEIGPGSPARIFAEILPS